LIVTEHLELVPATPGSIRTALAGPAALAESLDAVVPATWPHEYLDDAALQFMLARLLESPATSGWWLHFVLLRTEGRRILIGSAGYKGPPSEGAVEVGYGIVPDQHRRGYASEAVGGLLAHAFAVPAVERVIGETYPSLVPSIGVLEKCGFRRIEGGSEPGVIRFQITRSEYTAKGTCSAAAEKR
jgi:RimJ/RimL family protein N-acetyltransferase